ncbi:MAG: hypothetical protein O4861_20540 [Trichodesmium sp. St16_bin4-tuft]|nr:hypothetical protein [Trichodesmium sp. St4_bin8_1]MDE5073809.1 hypothetical protein [Trichodesmium sp. St5_bin8]MDE5076885.1 hypothetical protein [Trichodesmium sp. St2_bin6]MDE5100591.1 hypothetical protein [Trichodesmium sp. St16_bin4-tuft]MDE5101473.1 hypothetical protein [Trichodesmium sp. St19_bin2]
MSYSKFSLEQLLTKFNLNLVEFQGRFNNYPEVFPSKILQELLKEYIPLAVAIGSEKARSELILAPILVDIKKQLNNQISIFSGIEFNVNPDEGLNGFCDFIISRSTRQLIIEAPVITLVEAKNDNLKSGFSQCIAEMLAAQLFNKRKGNNINKIYGVVTTGTVWQFLELESETIIVDLEEYSINNLSKIFGILISLVS